MKVVWWHLGVSFCHLPRNSFVQYLQSHSGPGIVPGSGKESEKVVPCGGDFQVELRLSE